ncbi:MAG: hypothetical protein ABFE08_02045 [Armatimonadia bacterium]
MSRIFTVALLLLVLVASLALLTGCPKPQEKAVSQPTPEPTPPTAEPAAVPATGFAWTETPKLDKIPDAAVTGMINGKPFSAKTVRLEKRDGQVVLQIIDQKPDKPTGMVTGETGASLYLALPEGKPAEYVAGIKDAKKDPADAIYYYPQGGDKGPMTMNSDWGAALKIDEWKLAKDPSDPAALGTVKGKVAIVFADDPKSFVSGTFEGVYYK